MRRDTFPESDGMAVWLREDEVQTLLEELDGTRRRIAGLLAARCGLRREEIVEVTPADVVVGRDGALIRIQEGKGDEYREVPSPEQLAHYVEAWADSQGLEDDESLVGRRDKQVYRWVRGAADRLQERTDDEGWSDVTPHDLRRTWGTQLLEDGVLPVVVMKWGGWKDWETFRDHYLGEFSPKGLRRERAKVPYLEGDLDELDVDDRDVVPVATPPVSTAKRGET